jgi:hypothetical protein
MSSTATWAPSSAKTYNRSGAGSHVLASDLNKDGRLDIVTATRYGTFIFWGQAPGR